MELCPRNCVKLMSASIDEFRADIGTFLENAYAEAAEVVCWPHQFDFSSALHERHDICVQEEALAAGNLVTVK